MTVTDLQPPADRMLTADEVMARLKQEETQRHRAHQRRWAAVWTLRLAILAAFLVAWEWASRNQTIDPAFFSRPSEVWTFVGDFIRSGDAWTNGIVTLREMSTAFLIGSSAGIAFALLRVNFPFLADVSGPFITTLNSLPRVALAPMFVIWFGLGESSKVALAVSLVVFIVMITTEAGARSIESEYIVAMRAMGASRAQIFRKVLLPGSVPSIFAGLRLAVVYSLLGVVFGEMLAANAGLGQQIQFYGSTFRTDGVLGTLVLLAALALILNYVVGVLEARFSRWR